MRRGDIVAVSAAQSRAFYDDPLQVWTLPDDSTRLAALERMFLIALPVISLRHDECYTDDSGAVAALWMPPGSWHLPLPAPAITALAPLREVLGEEAMERQRVLNDAMAAVHPQELHWYLQGLGTDPPCQRRGFASAALAPVLARCDVDGTPAYLESTKVENVPFYESHGFAVTGTIDIPDGPSLFTMWRAPKPG